MASNFWLRDTQGLWRLILSLPHKIDSHNSSIYWSGDMICMREDNVIILLNGIHTRSFASFLSSYLYMPIIRTAFRQQRYWRRPFVEGLHNCITFLKWFKDEITLPIKVQILLQVNNKQNLESRAGTISLYMISKRSETPKDKIKRLVYLQNHILSWCIVYLFEWIKFRGISQEQWLTKRWDGKDPMICRSWSKMNHLRCI